MSPGSAGSRPSASAGSVSVPRSMARIASTVSGSGIAPPESANKRNGTSLGREVHEDVEDELADVGVDAASFLDRGDDRGEVVVGEDHRRRFSCDVGAGATHGDADVGAAQRGRVVDPVAGHRHDLALSAEGVGDAQLRLGRAAGEDQLAVGAKERVEVGVAHGVELVAGDGLVSVDADRPGDLRRGEPVVAGDDDDPDAGVVAARDGVGDLGAGRVEHGDEPDEAEVSLGVLAAFG